MLIKNLFGIYNRNCLGIRSPTSYRSILYGNFNKKKFGTLNQEKYRNFFILINFFLKGLHANNFFFPKLEAELFFDLSESKNIIYQVYVYIYIYIYIYT